MWGRIVTTPALTDTEVENNLLFILDVERWLDDNATLFDREHGGANPFAALTGIKPSGALTTEELLDAVHQS